MKIIKVLLVMFLIIIPIILIFCNTFFGYILVINKENYSDVKRLLELEEIYCQNPKLIIVESKANADDIIKILTVNFEDYKCNSDSEFIKYVEKKGIDVYDVLNKIGYIYIIIVAIIIFSKKFFENVDMFGKFDNMDD